MIVEGEKQGSGGVALGFAKGLGMIVPRVLVGVYEFVTCPIPAPADFRSILKPEFPWDYFDRRPSTAPASRYRAGPA